ncbi:MAG: CHAT domain-containing protein [Saprospiraceae bacterium]|nr:CHAT domain-containing protein [Candidatus Vicinibacter affinis]
MHAKELTEKALGKSHSSYADCIHYLAKVYHIKGDLPKAETHYRLAEEIIQGGELKFSLDYAEIEHSLGEFYLSTHDFQMAESKFLNSAEIQSKILGDRSDTYGLSLSSLALACEALGKFQETEKMLDKASAIKRKSLSNAQSFLSQKELTNFTATFQQDGFQLASFLYSRHAHNKNYNVLAAQHYNYTLFYKGYILSSAARLNNVISNSEQGKQIQLKLKGYSRRLVAEYAKPVSEQRGVTDLEKKVNDTEKELVRVLFGFGDPIKQVDWKDVTAQLKPTEAAVEFIHFKYLSNAKSDSILYGALILKSGSIHPQFVPLFEEKSLDSLLHSKSDRKADYVNSLYTLEDRGAVAIQASKKTLYEMIWKPLEEELSGIKTIYFSPSGLLHRINLDAIPINETETLADRFSLIELNSTRQLVIPTQIKNLGNDAVLYGGIQFELDSTFQHDEPMLASRSRGELSFSSVDPTLRGGSWNYLAGTDREVNSIEKILQTSGLQTSLKKGYSATEESFKNIGANNSASPRILHIATHGYFFNDPKTKNESSLNTDPVFKISDHPMLRSGLIMAGGNAAWQGKQTLEGREDGILTAYEISQMNLSNTELVVLSACETGLGDIQGNEGVYGLQRAFKIAGAKYLIMSLWQVPDKQTSLLMTTFYKKWLENKMTIPDAFHAAQKELREIGLDPYQWAGFVLVE